VCPWGAIPRGGFGTQENAPSRSGCAPPATSTEAERLCSPMTFKLHPARPRAARRQVADARRAGDPPARALRNRGPGNAVLALTPDPATPSAGAEAVGAFGAQDLSVSRRAGRAPCWAAPFRYARRAQARGRRPAASSPSPRIRAQENARLERGPAADAASPRLPGSASRARYRPGPLPGPGSAATSTTPCAPPDGTVPRP